MQFPSFVKFLICRLAGAGGTRAENSRSAAGKIKFIRKAQPVRNLLDAPTTGEQFKFGAPPQLPADELLQRDSEIAAELPAQAVPAAAGNSGQLVEPGACGEGAGHVIQQDAVAAAHRQMPFQLLRQMLRQLPGQLEDQRFQPEQLPPASRRGRRLAAAPPQLLIQPMPRTAARLPEYVASGQQFKLEVQRIERQLRAEIEFEVESGRHEIPVPRLQGEPLIPGMVDQFTRSGRDQENPVEAVAVPPAPAEFGLAELRDPAIQLPGQRRQRVVSRHSHESICFRTVIEFEESSDGI